MAKTLQVPVDDKTLEWVNKSKKEMKIKKDAEFIRMLLAYLMENEISELKERIEKARISAMLQEAEEKAQYALRVKAELEKQLEKLNA